MSSPCPLVLQIEIVEIELKRTKVVVAFLLSPPAADDATMPTEHVSLCQEAINAEGVRKELSRTRSYGAMKRPV